MSSSWKRVLSKKLTRTQTVKLDEIISKTVQNRGWRKQITNAKAINSWNRENVGKGVLANSQAYHIEAGKLYVLVSNSTWMNELTFLKPQIINNINQAIGKDVVKDIQFKIGDVDGYRKRGNQISEKYHSFTSLEDKSERSEESQDYRDLESRKSDLEQVELKQETIDKIDEAVLEIEDPELRESFRRVFIMYSKWQEGEGVKGHAHQVKHKKAHFSLEIN